MQPGHVHSERGDRGRPDRPDDALQVWGDRIQRLTDPVVIKGVSREAGSVPKISSTAHPRAQSWTWPSGAGLVSRFATSASITPPCISSAKSRMGQARSTIPAGSIRRTNSATNGNAPKVLSVTGDP